MVTTDENALFDGDGQRKYLCGSECARFMETARAADASTAAFCRLLAYTGCRISEALAVTTAHLDAEAGRVVFRTLKRRRRVFRAVPIPPSLMNELKALGIGLDRHSPLWSCSRQTAWRHVKRIMAAANIVGPQASPKGLRHQFGTIAAGNVPLHLTQRWLGHAKSQSTEIYQHAVGEEERRYMEMVWREIDQKNGAGVPNSPHQLTR